MKFIFISCKRCGIYWSQKGGYVIYVFQRSNIFVLKSERFEVFSQDRLLEKLKIFLKEFRIQKAISSKLGLHLEDLKKTTKYSIDDIKIGKPDAEHIMYVTMLLIKFTEELM